MADLAQGDAPRPSRVRVALVGGEHLHTTGILDAARASSTTDLVAMSVDDPELRAVLSSRYPDVPAFASAEQLYDTMAPDAILTCADNRRVADVVVDAARRGVHVMKEKPFAADLALADAMAAAATEHGVRLMVNWSTSWRPSVHAAKRIVEEGGIGRVVGVHVRAGHAGPPEGFAEMGPIERIGWGWLTDRTANGGGAAVDFCCYGAAVSSWLMGPPRHVVACGGNYTHPDLDVEDCCTMLLGYDGGHSVVEGTWVQPALPAPVPTTIYGEEGAVMVTGPAEVRIARRGRGTPHGHDGERVVVDPLPELLRSGPDHFTYCLLHDLPFSGLSSLEVARDAQEIVDAGLASLATGRRVELGPADGGHRAESGARQPAHGQVASGGAR